MSGMFKFSMKKSGILLLILSCLLTGCSNSDSAKMNEAGEESAAPVETDQTEQTGDGDSDAGIYVAEHEKYGLALPQADAFRDIFQDFIYWQYATMIEKEDRISIFSTLEEEKLLETDLKIHLFYRECDVEEMDNAESNIYDVVVTFPENPSLSYFSLSYNARGLSSDYDYGYDGWFSKDFEDDISSQELEKDKWFQKHYTFFGESSLILEKAKAENYEVKSNFPTGEKEQILSAIQKAVKKEYKKADDLVVYIRDFLPGDENLLGEVIDLAIHGKNDMPLYWINSFIYYSGAKMEKFEDVYWGTHYSTAYSGAGQPNYDPTVKWLKKQVKKEKDAVDVEKCILAYRIKNGKMIDLKNDDKKE